MQAAEFAMLRDLVCGEAGISLAPEEAYAIEDRLSRLVRAEHLRNIGELLITARAGTPLRQRICEAVAVHETRFFRDEEMFAALGATVIPNLLAHGRRELSVWSAAAASGQEAVSLAIVLRETCPEVAARILATDLSHAMVERARRGLYTQFEARRGLSPARLARHFETVADGVRTRPELRAAIEVLQLNLAGSWPQRARHDLVLLRNVLVYLHPTVREYVFARLREVLTPGGVLVLGATEWGPDHGFERFQIGRSVFYRLPEET